MMKIFNIVIILCLYCLILFGCENKKVTYELDRIIVNAFNDEEFEYDIETFETLYSGEIENVGNKIIIKNNNNMIFFGKTSESINGKIEMIDIGGGLIYITFENDGYKEHYETAEIRYYHEDKKYKELFLITNYKQIDNQYIHFAFVYKNSG